MEAVGQRIIPHITYSSLYCLIAFAASVWINDKFISTVHNGADHINALFPFPAGSVLKGKDNVITVLQDNMGNDEDANEKSARGISSFQLNGGTITTWKVQGKVGGYTKYAVSPLPWPARAAVRFVED